VRRPELSSLTWICAAALLGFAAALMSWTRAGEAPFPAGRDAAAVTAYLLDNGFHTDLAVPRAALAEGGGTLAQALARTPPGDWVLVGWGDARFYVDQSPIQNRLADGARAFFAPGNASVVMLDPYQGDPARLGAAERRRTLRLSPQGFAALRDRLEASLAAPDGAPVLAAARAGDDARFFASVETFWVGHLCNHWTAGLLNAGGVAVRPFRAIVSAELLAAVDRASLDSAGQGA
jgi:hypothetical protein